MNKKKINIGLDIGIASVGWSIIDEDYNLINTGVRLFDDPNHEKNGLANTKRREARSARRRIRRIKTRKQALLNWFVKVGLCKDVDEASEKINYDIRDFGCENPIELKIKAMNEKVSNDELIAVLFHYIHHRGYFYIDVDEIKDENISEVKDNSNEFPSVRLFNFYKEHGYYKDSEISGSISNLKYKEEIKHILKKQGKDEKFIDEYIKIFSMCRDFSTGPGSPSKYGIWNPDYLDENGQPKYKSIWEKNIGKCTYYPDQYRASKNSPISELFNLLNDINNLYLKGDKSNKLTKEQKDELFNELLLISNPKKTIKLEQIADILNKNSSESIKKEDIFGYRADSNEKPSPIKMDSFSYIVEFLSQNNLINPKDLLKTESLILLDDVYDFFAKNRDLIERKIHLGEFLKKRFNKQIDESSLESICSKIKNASATHSLSRKAIIEYIEYGLLNSDNQMVFFYNKIQKNKNNSNYSNKKYIPSNLLDEEVISPTTRRAYNQTVNVVNKILKLYTKEYDIENITIELARERNSKELKNIIKKINNKNKEDSEKLIDKNQIDLSKYSNSAKFKLKLKLKLWNEQDKKDLYDGKHIDINDIINNHQNYDVDHIIPYALSGDDSKNNKVLTKKYLNKEKSDNTPYQWLSSKGKFKEFEERVKSLNINKNKTSNLLYLGDPRENIGDFIGRNISDTRYASRCILNTFQDFFGNNEMYPNAKIRVINGNITNFARYNVFVNNNGNPLFIKNRDDYKHHAVDATIVNYLGTNNTISHLAKKAQMLSIDNKLYKKNDSSDSLSIINNETGEVLSFKEYCSINDKTIKLGKELSDFIHNNKVKFSRQMITRKNIGLSNETIYSFRYDKDTKEWNIYKKLDLFNDKNIDEFDKYFSDGADENKLKKVVCYSKDKKMFESLKAIYKFIKSNNPDTKENPFKLYMKEKGYNHPKFLLLPSNNMVRKIWIKVEPKQEDNLIILNSHQKKDAYFT